MSESKIVLILGNGQLAQMTRHAGEKIGVTVECLGVDQINSTYLKERYEKVDAILFESEFNDPKLFAPLKDQKKIIPNPKIMGLIQNKLRQKEIFASLKLAQPEFAAYIPELYTSVDMWATHTTKSSQTGVVFKWAMHGYDGKGVFIQTQPEPTKELFDFCKAGLAKNAELYSEQYIPFKREFAIVSTRSHTGVILHYPLVETIQKKGVCYSVEGPSSQLGVPPSVKTKQSKSQRRLANPKT